MMLTFYHRRRIYTEEKAKVVAASWRKLLQFLAMLAVFHQDELKNRVQINLFFNSSWCIIASAARI